MGLCGNPVAAVRRLLRNDNGATATEYAVVIGLIILVAMASIQAIGEKMYLLYDIINAAVPT